MVRAQSRKRPNRLRYQLLLDFRIQTDKNLAHNIPYITVVEKK